jgi:EPS-associated MarR family transcriptional regulator
MTSKRTQMQEDTHFRVLRLLQDHPEMSQRGLAEAVGVSVGGIHYVLSSLIDKGLVKLGNFTAAEDKRRYAYLLTPKGIARKSKLTRAFLARKVAEYEALMEEIEALHRELDDSAVEGLSLASNSEVRWEKN